jgi:hypothetical protein
MAPTTARGTSHRFRCPERKAPYRSRATGCGSARAILGGTGPHGPTASEARPVRGVLGHRTAASSDVRCRCGARPRPSRPGLWIRLLGETTGQPTIGDRPSADPGARREHGKGRPARPRASDITARVYPFRGLALDLRSPRRCDVFRAGGSSTSHRPRSARPTLASDRRSRAVRRPRTTALRW